MHTCEKQKLFFVTVQFYCQDKVQPKGSVDHFGDLGGHQLQHFDNLWPKKLIRTILKIYGPRNSQFQMISGSRNCTILKIYGSKNETFSGSRVPQNGAIFLCL